MPSRVLISNSASLVDHATAQKWVNAIQRQVALDMAPRWTRSAVLHYIGDSHNEQPGDGDGIIHLVPLSSATGTLGSHWLDGKVPTGEVGIQTCVDDNVAPSACLSHEILEMIIDEYASLCFQAGKLILAGEVCDRVEDSDDSYVIDGVLVENFSLPAAFLEGAPGPWDARRKCSSNVVLPNGYQLIIDLQTGQWQQATGALARASKRGARDGSRRASRMRRAGVDPSTLVLVAA